MNRFKKRTLALVLASVVTVVGSFATDNYKNSLMGLNFAASGNTVNMTVQTKNSYEGNVTPIRKNENTYMLILPEMNSQASTPSLQQASGIASVNIRTMPYSNTAKGYTVVTIKTQTPSTVISASSQVYVPTNRVEYIGTNIQQNIKQQGNNETIAKEKVEPKLVKKKIGKIEEEPVEEIQTESENQPLLKEDAPPLSGLIETPYQAPTVETAKGTDHDHALLWLWAVLITLVTVFIFVKARTKMQEIVGENLDINVKDETANDKKTKKINKIKTAINTLDSAYSKESRIPTRSEYSVPITPTKTVKPAEELNVVDLDELFQEHKSKNVPVESDEDENDALEDFLSTFSFEDDIVDESAEIEDNSGYDEEYYNKLVSNSDIRFTAEETECIIQLLNTEINDETFRNIDKYLVSIPISKAPSKEKILEDFITTYTIKQNVTFDSDDVNTLFKLINVELDGDFITDLRTNPQKTIEMEKDILAYGDKPKKASEIITLSVKDVLPDLSEALKKQGNKKIESNRKPETIYYSEGYDVSTLKLDESLPDLSVEINKKESYLSKPSAEFEVVDTNYTVGSNVLKTNSELPDLEDVMAHPEKYEQPKKEKIEVDIDALLNNISNVQFKPFYDGTNEFEVLNDISDVPSMSDIQQEFSQFEGFEIAQEESFEKNTISDEYDDFESLYSNEYVDLDKENAADLPVEQNFSNQNEAIVKKEVPQINNSIEKILEKTANNDNDTLSAEELIKKIEATKIEREIRKARLMRKEIVKKIENPEKPIISETIRCILDGQTYTVISSASIDARMGCHLAKNEEGYAILGYIGDKLINIKQYDVLKSEKIHVRMSEKVTDEISRYIVRIGIQKFIINVTNDNIVFVMDL